MSGPVPKSMGMLQTENYIWIRRSFLFLPLPARCSCRRQTRQHVSFRNPTNTVQKMSASPLAGEALDFRESAVPLSRKGKPTDQ